MIKFVLTLVILAMGLPLLAQTNVPVRLAVVAESDDNSSALDVLTAELSHQPNLQVLERDEINKVYQEQGLSAANKDYLKLSQILGADGLLLLSIVKNGPNQSLDIRLIAAKPGVALCHFTYPWPLGNLQDWSHIAISQIQPFLPKLLILPKDALAISILNLDSTVSSLQGEETERNLTQLLYSRLVEEKDVFVLERRRMDLLSQEKEFNTTNDVAFWNGSYLLAGVIDKYGYNRDLVTIDVQLTPPDKSTALSVRVTGARTNLAAVVNELANEIFATLKRAGSQAWNPEAEAGRYFSEAQWMYQWGMFQEAKSAAEAA